MCLSIDGCRWNAPDGECQDPDAWMASWTLVASISNVGGDRNWDDSQYTSPAPPDATCSLDRKEDCRATSYSTFQGTELLVVEDARGSVGIRMWGLEGPARSMQEIFNLPRQSNVYSSSELIQASGSNDMALAYDDDPGYLLVNTDLHGPDCTRNTEQCNRDPEACLQNECNDGCHLLGWWSTTGGGQCSSGLGCRVDQSTGYECSGDVITNSRGTRSYGDGGTRYDDHTVWLLLR